MTYDNWKATNPADAMDTSGLCPLCGAYSPRQCEMRGENGGECPWEMDDEDDGQPSEHQEWLDYDRDC
jgi:hypothetical protein